MDMKSGKHIVQLAQMAFMWEACAPKPGNVNRIHDFADTSLEDFLISAVAIGPALENAGEAGIGQTIWQATVDTHRWVRSNTNLGLVLLLAPLVKACFSVSTFSDITRVRQSLSSILNALTVGDARLAYAAIRLAHPGGMGHVSQADVAEEPSITLLQAMALARDRDAIAQEYVTDFVITFDIGFPALKEAQSRGADFSNAVVQTFLSILSRVPDTLIARKKGFETAGRISRQAGEVLRRGGVFTSEGRAGLAEMDRALRDESHTLNPGATADLTAAAVFLALLEMPAFAETRG
jgi:triphosphoribosyl-dephospho-CoA synthase